MDGLSLVLKNIFSTPVFYIGSTSFSVGSIILLILLTFAVLVGSRVFSQLIKRSLLRKLDRGIQETVTSITNYVLSTIGVIIVLQSAGINLSSLTVIAGVLGIGLGFGFQNLAANFISGLAILFEQPIKVGDYVEVNGLLGTVEKISIRATIVRTNDDVFVIVPNSKLLDGNIVNWSYRRPQCRLHIPISVGYGTDPVLVTEILIASACMEPAVLRSPPPKVWLKKFGENSLDFQVLVWIDQPQESEPIKSAINFHIESELRHHNIEIPYPHREIRIQNLDALKKLTTDPPESQNSPTAITETKKVQRMATKRALRDLLRKITYFEGCTDLELRSLIEQGYRQSVQSGEVIFKEGEMGDALYIVLSGSVEVISLRTGQYINTCKEGDFFGEIAVLMGTVRTATVRALQDTTLFVVNHDHLQKFLKNHPNLAEQIAQKLSERQQMLIDMGLINSEDLSNNGQTPFTWVLKRLHTLFGI